MNADDLIALVCVFDQMAAAAAAEHEIVSDLLQVDGSAAACSLAAAVAAFLDASTFLRSWLFVFWNSGETDRLRTISSISGPGINAFSWGRGCKGKLKNKEREFFASFSSTLAPVVQVSLFGILAGRLLALCEREFWKERYLSIISNDVRDADVESPEYLFEAAFGTCRSQPEKLEAVQSGQNIHFFIKGARGTQTQVVRGGSRVSLGLVAGVTGLDVYAMVGGRIVDHSFSLGRLGITSNCTVTFSRLRGGSRENVPGQWTCSNCLAENTEFWTWSHSQMNTWSDLESYMRILRQVNRRLYIVPQRQRKAIIVFAISRYIRISDISIRLEMSQGTRYIQNSARGQHDTSRIITENSSANAHPKRRLNAVHPEKQSV